VEDHSGGFNVFSDIVKSPAAYYLTVTEYPLRTGYLRMKKFCTYRIAFAFSPEGAANSREQYIRFFQINSPFDAGYQL
jgi:hypothetical protein